MNDIESDLEETKKATMFLFAKGGRYRGQLDYNDAVMLVYTPRPLRQHHYGPSGLANTIIFNALPRAARNTSVAQRVAFWERIRANG